MEQFFIEMRKVSRLIDEYTERWAADTKPDEQKWKEMVDLFLAMSRLAPSAYDIIIKDAEGKKRWELHLRGKLSEDEFEVKA